MKGLMERFLKIIKITFGTIFVLSILFVAMYMFGAKHIGTLEAKYDLMRGHCEIRGYGLGPFMAYQEDWSVFKSHGIKFVAVAGCVVNDFIIENVAAYNSVMRTAILDKLGIDIDRMKYYESP